jgi:hypothetical protein
VIAPAAFLTIVVLLWALVLIGVALRFLASHRQLAVHEYAEDVLLFVAILAANLIVGCSRLIRTLGLAGTGRELTAFERELQEEGMIPN